MCKKDCKCPTCSCRAWRQSNSDKYFYQNLKYNAKRRGINFTLTFEEFVKFAYETEYIKGRGRSISSLTVDRIDNSLGYSIDNIQVLTKSQNSSKGKKLLVYSWQDRSATVKTLESPFIIEEDPDWLKF